MPSKYYQSGPTRAKGVEDLFAKLAPHYDRINDLQSFGFHRIWKRRLIRLAAVRAQDQVLDICCGTGDIALRLAVMGAKVTGLDFSAAMLTVAEQRARKLGLHPSTANFVRGDALNLPFADDSFDLVTIAYGLRNLADLEQGISEITRVLRPAGRLLILDFGKPDHPLWRWLYFLYLRWAVPVFGKVFCGDADTHGYILDSLKAYPAQEGILNRLHAIGYTDTRLIQLLGGVMSIHVGHCPSEIVPAPKWTHSHSASTVPL